MSKRAFTVLRQYRIDGLSALDVSCHVCGGQWTHKRLDLAERVRCPTCQTARGEAGRTERNQRNYAMRQEERAARALRREDKPTGICRWCLNLSWRRVQGQRVEDPSRGYRSLTNVVGPDGLCRGCGKGYEPERVEPMILLSSNGGYDK